LYAPSGRDVSLDDIVEEHHEDTSLGKITDRLKQ